MIATRSSLLACALLCGALVVGCGSSSSSTGGSTSTGAPAPSSTSAPAAGATSTSSPTTSNSAAEVAVVAQYVAVCKAIIAKVPTLSTGEKARVEAICTKAAGGDVEGARAAAKEVCAEVVKASPIAGAAREKALAACKAA